MCISRVGKIVSIRGKKATVMLLGDDRRVDEVDVSMLDVRVNSYVEIFANLALTNVNPKEARERRKAWLEINRFRK